ncbi:MAG: hypothetical protein AAF938_03455 [Myxococcota bacterium]
MSFSGTIRNRGRLAVGGGVAVHHGDEVRVCGAFHLGVQYLSRRGFVFGLPLEIAAVQGRNNSDMELIVSRGVELGWTGTR